MPTIRLQRHAKLDLEFEGELIASSTSDDGIKPRWQSYRLYRKDSGGYVLERLGESRLAGEVTMHYVYELTNPNRVVKQLERKDGDRRYLTIVAQELIDQASENDERFRTEAVERAAS